MLSEAVLVLVIARTILVDILLAARDYYDCRYAHDI